MRHVIPLALAVGALSMAVAACGDDDGGSDRASTSTASAQEADFTSPPYAGDPGATTKPSADSLADLEKVTTADEQKLKPSIAGVSDLPVPEQVKTLSNDISTFWQQVFNNSKLEFPPVDTVLVDERGVRSECGNVIQRDGGFEYCEKGPTMYYPIGTFEIFSNQVGDAGTAVLMGSMWGWRVQDLLGQFQKTEDGSLLAKQTACFSGVWFSTVQKRNAIEEGDIEEAFDTQAVVVLSQDPNGADNQVAGFKAGFETGDPNACALDKLQGQAG